MFSWTWDTTKVIDTNLPEMQQPVQCKKRFNRFNNRDEVQATLLTDEILLLSIHVHCWKRIFATPLINEQWTVTRCFAHLNPVKRVRWKSTWHWTIVINHTGPPKESSLTRGGVTQGGWTPPYIPALFLEVVQQKHCSTRPPVQASPVLQGSQLYLIFKHAVIKQNQ